ncbi:MAG: phosphonate C-P lyase system protein PhnG [Campylobacteraceae bacterium]|nr:phosphonate C-P lyase system protein PhnG [Campylobacteraceae bacterium]
MKREDINVLCQEVDIKKLENIYKIINKNHKIRVLTKASEQTLLVPVKDPISNGSFYAGEVLVTSTILEVNKTKGWSMVMDSNYDLSLYTAVVDACFEADIYKNEIIELLEKAKEDKNKKIKMRNKKVNSTKVSFDLM